MKKRTLSETEIRHLALLANLSLNSAEIKKYLSQLEETIEYVENLNELATDKVSPTSSTVHQENIFFADGTKNTRNLPVQSALKNAGNKKNNFFVVKRIMY